MHGRMVTLGSAVALCFACLQCVSLLFVSLVHANEGIKPVELLPISEGATLAQFGSPERPHTLLVLQDDGSSLQGVDLSATLGRFEANPFDVIADLDYEVLAAREARVEVSMNNLLPLGRWCNANVAAGVNYRAHAEESEVEGGGFLFPKLADATPSVASIIARPDAMLDYEVELAATFDRDLRSVSDLENARVGFFVCIDFTERATLARRVDRKNVQSGKGFPEAKGFAGSFQTGPYMVVPNDWRAFMERAWLQLTVNGELRQRADVEMMETPLPGLLEQALAHGSFAKWSYYGRPVALLPAGYFPKGTTLLTGTPEGVIFAPPASSFILRKAARGVLTLQFLRDGLQPYVVEQFIASEIASRRFLQPGDTVVATGFRLGNITSPVVSTP